MKRATLAANKLAADVVYAGFSFGAVCALSMAARRTGAKGCLASHGARAAAQFGVTKWPPHLPVQIHFSALDPFLDRAEIETLGSDVRLSGSSFEYLEYDRGGHLFADPDLHDYDAGSAELMWQRSEAFLASV